MTDFAAYSAGTHPLVKAIDDYNSILDHGLEKTANFIIRKNGVYYEALLGSGSTGAGKISYGGSGNAGTVDGTNPAAVIQEVLNQSPSTICVKDMDATLTAVLSYPSRVAIFGSGVGKTIFRSAVNDYVFKPAAATEKNHVQIKDLSVVLTADGAAQGGVNLDGTSFAVLENLAFTATSTKANIVGVKLVDTHQVGCYFNQLRSIDVNNYAKGLYFATDAGAWYANNNSVFGGRFSGCTVGTHFEAGSVNWMFNPDFEGNTTAIKTATNNNGLIGGYFEGNTTDILTDDADSGFVALGARRDITITETGGIVQFLGSGYGNEYNYLHGYSTGMNMRLQYEYLGTTYAAPGAAYILFGTATATRIDTINYKPRYARVLVTAEGNEAGNGKGVEIYAPDIPAQLCEVTWNGVGVQDTLPGAWTALPAGFYGLPNLRLQARVKASSGTEDMTLYQVDAQFK